MKLVRPMTWADLPAVARVHQDAFSGFFLDQMGPAFLKQYYASILDYGQGVALVLEREPGHIAGFAAGFLDPQAFYAHFRQRRLRFIPSMLLAVIRRPSLVKRILANSRRVSSPALTSETTGELASIGVSGRGGGVGSVLLEAFCDQMFEVGADRVTLSTDAEDNRLTRAFYERRGFVLTGEELRQDRLLCLYERRAPGLPPPVSAA